MYFNFCIKVPIFLARIYLWILLRYKKFRFGSKLNYIPLKQGRFVIVDSADYEKLIKHNWTATIVTVYAVRIEKGKTIYMHNEIMQPQAGLIIDHKDHNGLNNSRVNLRLATRSQNSCNRKKRAGCSSKYIGVSMDKKTGKWQAAIMIEGTRIFLGNFDNEIAAAMAYDKAAILYHKEFASLNFPEDSQKDYTHESFYKFLLRCFLKL